MRDFFPMLFWWKELKPLQIWLALYWLYCFTGYLIEFNRIDLFLILFILKDWTDFNFRGYFSAFDGINLTSISNIRKRIKVFWFYYWNRHGIHQERNENNCTTIDGIEMRMNRNDIRLDWNVSNMPVFLIHFNLIQFKPSYRVLRYARIVLPRVLYFVEVNFALFR